MIEARSGQESRRNAQAMARPRHTPSGQWPGVALISRMGMRQYTSGPLGKYANSPQQGIKTPL
jgi:hypothetical protein